MRDLLPELEDPRDPRWPGLQADVSKLSNCSHMNCYYISNFRVFRVFRGSFLSGNSVVALMDTYLVAYDTSNPQAAAQGRVNARTLAFEGNFP